jgi:xanthine dehydrogenase YagS FAD-binding subunit
VRDFQYLQAKRLDEALELKTSRPSAKFLAGGTNLIDHLKLGVEAPEALIDIRQLGWDKIEWTHEGVTVGAGVTNSALAYDPGIVAAFPVLSKAILAGASPQLRNAATTGGNLLQRTRCYYFRDIHSPCNKREPGSGCSAISGINRIHAILGTSPKCIATHPSDMAVALAALDAVILTSGKTETKKIPIRSFYVPYGEDPARENVLPPDWLITGVWIPKIPWFKHSVYVKARDRASYEFALSSAAVALDLEAGMVRDCRIALGGVGTKPWNASRAEAALLGKAANEASFRAASEAELAVAVPQKDNGFKIELCKRVMLKALTLATNGRKVEL